MSKKNWGAPTTWDEVCRRAAGRNHYNSWRQLKAAVRRRQVAELLLKWGYTQGVQVRIAAELGVSEATVSRDIAWLLPSLTVCPCCGGLMVGDKPITQRTNIAKIMRSKPGGQDS